MGDGDYMWAFQKVVMPIATEFNPDLVISKWHFLEYGHFLTLLQFRPDLTLRLAMSWAAASCLLPAMLR